MEEIYAGMTREDIIEKLIDNIADALEGGGFSISTLLKLGHKGFNNFTDEELIEEYKQIENFYPSN